MSERAKRATAVLCGRCDKEEQMNIAFLALAAAIAGPAAAQMTTSTTTTNQSSSEVTPPIAVVHHARRHHHVHHHATVATHVTSANVKAPAGGTATSTATTVTKQ